MQRPARNDKHPPAPNWREALPLGWLSVVRLAERKVPPDMSSRPLLIAGIVGGILVGAALFALALAVVAIDGPALSGQTMAMVVLGAGLGFVLDATWITLAVDRLLKLGRGGDDEDGGTGWGKPGPGPRPSPPPDEFDWWPEFERDLRRYRDERERAPMAD